MKAYTDINNNIMNKNLNLVEILKDCPRGTKLYYTVSGEVEFDHVAISSKHPIVLRLKGIEGYESLTSEGKYDIEHDGECLLFPSKEQRDWSKFTAPWYKKEPEPRFNVGDWVVFITSESVYKVEKKENYEYTLRHILGGSMCLPFSNEELIREWTIEDAKDGDVLTTSTGQFIYNGKRCGSSCLGCYCGINTLGRFERCICETNWTSEKVYPATKEQRDALMKTMNDAGYKWNAETKTLEKLVKPKFDPKTLHTYDRVLARDTENSTWRGTLFSHYNKNNGISYPFITVGGAFGLCIPYNEDTKHLVGTTEEAPEYYHYWED